MTITLSYNKSEKNHFAKELIQLLYIEGTLREGSSLIDPVIMVYGLDQSVTVDGVVYNILRSINYAYIPNFGRKYFITDIVTDANGLFIIHLHCDVLSTYYQQLSETSAIVKRQENSWNLYLDDGIFKTYQNPNIVVKPFPSGFNTQSYVLSIAGSN